jgi:hypothetical protein
MTNNDLINKYKKVNLHTNIYKMHEFGLIPEPVKNLVQCFIYVNSISVKKQKHSEF